MIGKAFEMAGNESRLPSLDEEGWSAASDEEEVREREAIRFCTCGCCDDDNETAFFRLAPDDEDSGVAMGDEPVDSRRVEPDLHRRSLCFLGRRFLVHMGKKERGSQKSFSKNKS